MGSNKKAKKHLKISVYTNPELFGEEEIMEGLDYRKCTAICNSAYGQCILIKKSDFEMRLMNEQCTLQYLKERLEIKNQRMKEKLEVINKQLDNYQEYIYNNPKDFQRPSFNFNRVSQDSKQLEQNLSGLKDMLQSGQLPQKKPNNSSRIDINFNDEGIIKSKTQLDDNENNSLKDENEKNDTPLRSYSPSRQYSFSKVERKSQESLLEKHFLESIQKHIHKSKKKGSFNSQFKTSQNLTQSYAELSPTNQMRSSQAQLQSQPSLQKFSSLSKFDGQDYSPIQHKMTKSQIFPDLKNKRNSQKTQMPPISCKSQTDFSSLIQSQKFNKIKLQQSLLKPPQILKQYYNREGEEDLNSINSRTKSCLFIQKTSSWLTPTIAQEQSKQNSSNNYQLFSQSQTEFPIDFLKENQNQKNNNQDDNYLKTENPYIRSKKGKSATQIIPRNENIIQDFEFKIPPLQFRHNSSDEPSKDSIYLIKIQSQDNKNESPENSQIGFQSQLFQSVNQNSFIIQPPLHQSNLEQQQKVLTFSKQSSQNRSSLISTPQQIQDDKLDIIGNQDSPLFFRKQSPQIPIIKKTNSIGNIQQIKTLGNLSESDLIISNQTSIQQLSNSQKLKKTQIKELNSSRYIQQLNDVNQMSHKSVSSIIQQSLRNIDSAQKNAFIKSSGYLSEQMTSQQSISPLKGFGGIGGRAQFSQSKSPVKQQYKFQMQFDSNNKKNEILIEDKQFNLSKSKVRIYEAIHQNPKSTKSFKDSLKEHSNKLNDHLSNLQKSSNYKLKPIKIQNSNQQKNELSFIFSRQNDNSIQMKNNPDFYSSSTRAQKNDHFNQKYSNKNEYGFQSNQQLASNQNNNKNSFTIPN